MKKRLLKAFVTIVVVGVMFGGAAFGAIAWHIHQAVRENCRDGQQAHPHPGDDVAALIEFMNSTSHAMWDRNHLAIWTLGRLRDPRALPALEAVYTGGPCDHEKNLCQYELEKAIRSCGGKPSAVSY